MASDPNICGVGYGAKLRSGQPVAAASVVFLVREKLVAPEEIAARGSWAVPSEVEGFSTDVVEVGLLAAASADRALPSGSKPTGSSFRS